MNKALLIAIVDGILAERLPERGPRGQRGKPGRDGLSAYEIWSKENKGSEKEFLKSLIGKNGIQGLNGLNGKDGKDGQDGEDGKDAPTIEDVRVLDSKDRFWFKFYFSDGSTLETNKLDLPKASKAIQVSDQTFQMSLKDYQNTTIQYDANKRAIQIRNYFDADKQYLGSIEDITYSNNFVNYVTERIYNGSGPDENTPNSLLSTNRIDLMYVDSFVTEIKVTEQ